jgi:hypothetical protein
MLSFVAMEYFRSSPVMAFPLIALALFMSVFFIVTLRTVLTQKSRWQAAERLPLEDHGAQSGDANE